MFTELYYIEMAALYLMVSKLQTYNSVTMETPVWGPDGLFEKLESYFVDDYPLINCHHKQARGEVFTQWWETKMRKAKELALMMTNDS